MHYKAELIYHLNLVQQSVEQSMGTLIVENTTAKMQMYFYDCI